MHNYLWYIFEANVVITLLFCVFKLTQRFLSFGWQRFSLLSIPVLSVLAVWIKHTGVSESEWSYRIPVFELETVTVNPVQTEVPTGFDYSVLLETAYWLGVALLAVWMIYNLYQVFRLFLGSKHTKEKGFTLVELPNEAPASFFRFIQLPAGLSAHDREIIFQHEQVHAQKFHSADRLFLEAAHCLSWFNPVFLLMKKELIHIHEFEVDRIMYNKYRVGYMEFLLAYSLGTSSSIYSFTNQFMSKLTLIKRIKTMKNKSKRIVAAAFALPIIAGALTLVSFTSEADQEPTKKQTSKEASKSKQGTKSAAASGKTAAPAGNPTEKQVESKSKAAPEKKVERIEPVKEIKHPELDKLAEYPGGMEAMIKYLVGNIRYPETAVKSKTTGKVYVEFEVSKNGEISNATVKRGVSKELDAEAVRVISSMPNWVPAEKDDKTVDSKMVLPIQFEL